MEDIRNILRRVLLEGVSDLAYHVTEIDNLESILKSGKIYTSPAITDIEKKYAGAKLFFLSTTSSRYVKQGFGARQNEETGLVVLELDGKALNANFKSKRVDYWGDLSKGRDPLKYKARFGGDPNYLDRFMKDDEMEDRIVTDKPYISPLSKYIISIHVLLPTDPRGIGENMIKYIDQRISEIGISTYYYLPDDINNFFLLRKDKSVSLEKVMLHLSSIGTGFDPHFKENPLMSYGFYYVLGIIYKFGSKDFINELKDNDTFLDMLKSEGETFDDFLDKMKSYDTYKLKYFNHYDIEGYSSSINNFLHNSRKTKTSLLRDVVVQFFKVMKSMKVKTIEGLMEKIYELSEK